MKLAYELRKYRIFREFLFIKFKRTNKSIYIYIYTYDILDKVSCLNNTYYLNYLLVLFIYVC